ncbi:HK97 gp10 family phage protein [Scatolibacter rhodanostii]|uniref:HK97 gp10 family phage protein n=1 Tax=Scatolibacter rhodanostii TaxID=2014781 RepID=UPI0013565E1C|nr:HK97 gp10 family phage protein [Scatolibacter rhodanostii]
MSKNVNYEDLKNLLKRLEAAEQESPAFVEKLAKQIAARLLRALKKNTPVYETPDYLNPIKDYEKRAQYQFKRTGGTLRRAWTAERVQIKGDIVQITIFNPMEYASYVNYGHRQTPGRYVPQIGLRLKKSWVQGSFFMEKSENQTEQYIQQMLEPQIMQFLKGVFDGK